MKKTPHIPEAQIECIDITKVYNTSIFTENTFQNFEKKSTLKFGNSNQKPEFLTPENLEILVDEYLMHPLFGQMQSMDKRNDMS